MSWYGRSAKPKQMNNGELKAARDRTKAAYPFERGGYFDIEHCQIGDKSTFFLVGGLIDTEEVAKRDKEFIENARQDILALLDVVDQLREALRLIYEMPSDAPAALKICKGIARGALMPEEFTGYKERK